MQLKDAKNKEEKEKLSSLGMTFFGTFNIDRMFDIHDNEHVELHNHFEQEKQARNTTTNETNAPAPSFSQYVSKPECAEAVLMKLHELMERQASPKSKLMPLRAAMDAGAIGRPTWQVFCTEFGENFISSKSALSRYTEKSYCYEGEDFNEMKAIFREIIS